MNRAFDIYRSYVFSLLLVLIAFALRLTLDPWLDDRSPLLPFTAAIVIATGLYGIAPGLFATTLSLVLGVAFFMIPSSRFALSVDQLVSIAVFLITAAAMLVFADHLRLARTKAEHLRLQLQYAQNTRAMGTMAVTLAHELNQPLAASANYLAACKQMATRLQGEDKALFSTGLSEAENQIQRCGNIIRHARALVANVQALHRTSSVKKMLARVLDVAEASDLTSNVTIQASVDKSADAVTVDPIQVEQVLLNVVRNACEAMRSGSEKPRLSIRGQVAGSQCQIEIRDNGPGIPAGRLDSLFSASEGSTTGGLGLGLAISRTIIEAHGGAIWAENNPGGGASFFLTLPLASADTGKTAA